MSIRTEFKGIIRKVSEPKETKNGNHFIEIIVEQPPYTNEFGEQKGQANHYKVSQFKKSPDDFTGAENMVDKKASITAYLNGNEFTTSTGLGYALNLNVKEIILIEN